MALKAISLNGISEGVCVRRETPGHPSFNEAKRNVWVKEG